MQARSSEGRRGRMADLLIDGCRLTRAYVCVCMSGGVRTTQQTVAVCHPTGVSDTHVTEGCGPVGQLWGATSIPPAWRAKDEAPWAMNQSHTVCRLLASLLPHSAICRRQDRLVCRHCFV